MRPALRLRLAVGASLAVIATVAFTSQTGAAPTAERPAAHRGAASLDAAQRAVADEVQHHNDAATKNTITRTTEADADTTDPTTPQQRASNARSAAAQRNETPPPLRHVPVDPPQPTVPTDRYNMFNACYGVQSTATRRWLQGTTFSATDSASATPLYFKPTELGRYLLYSPDRTYLGTTGLLGGGVGYATAPGEQTNWTVTEAGTGQFRFFLPGSGYLAAGAGGAAVFVPAPSGATQFTPYRVAGCTPFPEISTNVEGDPTAGTTPYEETRGYIDAHTHGMAFEFLGGDAHCGRPWSPWGVETALKDCPDHYYSQGYGAVLEDFLSGTTHHDPVGWPTFKDWPAPHSLTHEGTYYKWMERSWRAGQRVLVNLLVENNQLCMLYPIKHNSCDDMDSIRLQAKDMHLLENYVDAQHGGPGKGWYRIVTNPRQAREVINAGKMAVIMGIETSVPFGCHLHFGQPTCDAAQISSQLDEVKKMGVVQMELVNKFDNALAGVAGDAGSTGYLVNSANALETGSPWHMDTCNPNDPEVHDKDQDNSAPIPSQDALFGAILKTLPSAVAGAIPAVPVYPAKHHCNNLGLSDLGVDTIKGLAQRHMIFDPDHMSVKARKQALDLVDQLGYTGVVSSHSWSTPDAYPRIYGEKGFITPYAGDSTGFVAKWRQHLGWANPATYWGFGFGADINGFGAQGDARPDAATNHPVTYPFTGLGGVQVDQQVSGQRVYDINKDGVAHYGLYPDWIQDLRMLAGDDIVKDMERGPEAYLQMWERADGIAPNACTNPDQLKPASYFHSALRRGTDWWQTLQKVGQPDRRLDHQFSYCSTGGTVTVNFDDAGKVTTVTD
jgi:microsomal dipeptidase-like Zn-dependent dipeptidase